MKVIRHPNGFLKVTLRCGDNGSGLRVHVWDEPYADADIHSHKWDFTSAISLGELAEEIYECDDDPAGPFCRYGKAGEVLTFRSHCRVRLVSSRTYRAGESYQRDRHVLHKVSNSGPAVTVVQTGPEISGVTTVIRRRGA